MITEKERDEIVNIVIERILVKMPEVIGNLMTSVAERNKFKKEIFEKYPEFKGNELVVAKLYEEEASHDLTLSVDQIISRVVPKARARIKQLSALDMETIQQPTQQTRQIKESFEQIKSSNGEL